VNNIAILPLLYLSAFIVVTSIAYIVWPLWRIYRDERISLSDATPSIFYFSAIGLGFMMIEVSQMQRLMIFLGHPIYSLSVVIFTLLLSGSAGSYAQSRWLCGLQSWKLPAMLCIVLIGTGLVTVPITEDLKYYDTGLRIIVSAVLLMPAGFLMGTMLPAGVALAARHASLLPWYWGLNGVASVFASVLSLVTSLQFGISSTYWIGVGCYVVCLPVTLFAARIKDAGESSSIR
jgi:hypothetical protein